MKNAIRHRWESVDVFGFKDGPRLAWITWEKTLDRGIAIGGDRRAVAVRELDSHGPRVDLREAV